MAFSKKLDVELNLVILFTKISALFIRPRKSLMTQNRNVWVSCLWLRFSKGHRTGYIWAHKNMKTNDNGFDNLKNPDRINNYLTSTYTKGKYILNAWLYYCLNGWFRVILNSYHITLENSIIYWYWPMLKIFCVLNAAVIV